MNKIVISLVMTVSLLTAAVHAGDVVVIVNKDNAQTEIAAADIEKMFLGKMSDWPAGGKVQPCDQKVETKAAELFCKTYLKKSVADYQALWMEKMLSGAATPPKSAANDQDVINFVTATKGAIGYIDGATAPGDGVKKVTVK